MSTCQQATTPTWAPTRYGRSPAPLRRTITERTGLVASVGAGSSKLVAKIASDLDKPDGLLVVPPGEELTLLHALPVTRLWGVGPATAQRLQRMGVTTVAELAGVPVDELIGLVGQSVGAGLAAQARGEDDREVIADRELKSVGAEETFDTDVADPARLRDELDLMANRTARRLRSSGHSARTVTLKVRLHDFRTLSRSLTLPGATDDEAVIRRVVRRLLADVDVSDGVRLLGVACSGLSDHVQDELPDLVPEAVAPVVVAEQPARRPVEPVLASVARRAGRGARGVRPGLGAGLGGRPGDRPVRRRARPAGQGPDVLRRRPGAACLPSRRRTCPDGRSSSSGREGVDPAQEAADVEMAGELFAVVVAGQPELLPVGSVQGGVVPHEGVLGGKPAALGRAHRGLRGLRVGGCEVISRAWHEEAVPGDHGGRHPAPLRSH